MKVGENLLLVFAFFGKILKGISAMEKNGQERLKIVVFKCNIS